MLFSNEGYFTLFFEVCYLNYYSQRYHNAFKAHTYFIYITQECSKIKHLLFPSLSLATPQMGRDKRNQYFKKGKRKQY